VLEAAYVGLVVRGKGTAPNHPSVPYHPNIPNYPMFQNICYFSTYVGSHIMYVPYSRTRPLLLAVILFYLMKNSNRWKRLGMRLKLLHLTLCTCVSEKSHCASLVGKSNA
jgi:hypothetical protein